MSNTGKWDLDTTLKFIQCYKLHECLWNFSSPNYKIKQKRDAAYIAIVNEMNIDNFGVQEVKNKIKNLRSTYSQELKKIEDSKKSGAGLDHVYSSNIKWLKEMEEVFVNELKRKTFENVSIPSISQVPERMPPESGSQCLAAAGENSSQSTITDATIAITPLRPKKRSREIVNAIHELKTLHDQVNTEEESPFDVFGKSVALQLKKISVENALLAQQKIQCILTEIGIMDYREKTATIGNISSMSNYSQSVPTPSSSHSDFCDVDDLQLPEGTATTYGQEVYYVIETPESSGTNTSTVVSTDDLIQSAMLAALDSNRTE